MKTIIAEKPSVAREIARIVGATKREEGYFEGGGYAVTWAFGHLVQLAMPDGYGIRGFVRDNLPVIPETFTLIPRQEKTEKGYKPDSGVVSQIKIIARLFKESEQIIVATDAGREGELIFRYLYHYIGCTTPFVRLWISSLTDKAIREGLRNLEAGDKYDNLYLAAKARSESDWLVGINGTQALSIAAGHGTYSVGRVQTPTLAMVCARYWENRRFTVEPFWQLHIAADTGDGEVVKLSSSKKWKEKEPATALYNKVKEAGFATVTKAERKEKTEETPLLYDLTTLQKEANAKHGFTAEQTLEIAQKLYEKKLITYPRTGSRYIPEDVFAEIPKLLAFIGTQPPVGQAAEPYPVQKAGKDTAAPVRQVAHQVVSSLSQPMSIAEFVASFSQERNRSFNTAVGVTTVSDKNTLSACVYGAQSVTDGQAVKLRLLEPMAVADKIIPRNAVVIGTAKIQGERLDIEITSLEYAGTIIPVELVVYDTDGQPGIFIPNSMEMNAVREVAANMGGSLGSSINISTNAGAQLASDLGKGLIQGTSQYIAKKMRTVKVHLKAGYKVMLYQDRN